MELRAIPEGFALYKENAEIGRCAVHQTDCGAAFGGLCVDAAWRCRGYGSYLIKEVLRRFGGYARETATVFTAPLPQSEAEAALWAKFGFRAENGRLVRRREPDMSAVRLAQDFLSMQLSAPRLCVDATCGNGGDTAFLCRLVGEEGRVLGFDIQQKALNATCARLERENIPRQRYALLCDSHENLLRHVAPGTADAVMFNFGWLPGAEHSVHSTAQSSLPALEAALTALRPGGILSAVLYSGQVIGSSEKQAVLAWLRALPLEKYTVLVCDFANWADTAPLPCFVRKK